jgi:hypothetical protein
MSRPSFIEGVLVALALSAVGGIAAAALPTLFGAAIGSRLLVAALAAVYIGYLLRRSREKTGRMVVPCLWLTATVAGWALLPVTGFALLQVCLVWLIRALYFHGGVLAALADLGLSVFALAAAVWALGSGSWPLALWSFFLVQALFPWIPSLTPGAYPDSPTDNDCFEEARVLAEAALKRLASAR